VITVLSRRETAYFTEIAGISFSYLSH